jgi:hypothetical protein
MAVTTTNTNKPINPRGEDKSPLAFNRAKIYSGKALDFDGVNDNISFTDFEMTSGNKYTLCIYANRDLDGMIWSKDNQWIEVRFLSNVLQLRVYNNGVGSWTIYTLIDNVPANEWHQIIVTYDVDANTWKSYLNGQFIKTLTAVEPSNKIINRIGSSASTFYNGELSNAKIFEVELTAAQVLDLYNNPEKIVPTGVDNTALKLWLPMMEGAGTTAYDGSGNGNHGTISGATWTQGVGAPVAQTAVIDWNKGTNLFTYSNDFSQSDWKTTSGSSFVGGQSGYDGSSDAWLFTDSGAVSGYGAYQDKVINGVHTYSIYVKEGSTSTFVIDSFQSPRPSVTIDLTNGNVTASNEIDAKSELISNGWYRLSLTFNASSTLYMRLGCNGAGSVYIQNAQLESASTAGAYVLTLSSAQSSEVLIPQSLTSGRDLFYNSFENVRKQYALNLDGQSWAEIHDNESLDFGTGSFSLEAWARVNYVNQGSAFNVILGLGGNASDAGRTFLYYNGTFNIAAFTYSNNSSASLTQTIGDWVHLVGSYDGTNATLYLNGVQVDQDARTAVDMTNDLVKMIGRDITAVRYYNDQIAQPRIYNRALTADEVEQNYNAGKNTYS